MAEITYEMTGDGWIDKLIDTGTDPNTPARVHPHSAYRTLSVSTEDGDISNDGADTETVMISVVDGLEVVRGTDPADATVLDYDGDVTLSIDGVETTKTLSNGNVSFNLTTDKSAGSTITVTAKSLADHPAESDSAEIEVVSQ